VVVVEVAAEVTIAIGYQSQAKYSIPAEDMCKTSQNVVVLVLLLLLLLLLTTTAL